MPCSLLARTCVTRASTRLSCDTTTFHVIQRHIIRTCISLITTIIVVSNILHVWMVPMVNATTPPKMQAIKMRSECEESVEHLWGTLWNDKYIIERSRNVLPCNYRQVCWHTKFSSSDRTNTRSSIPHVYDKCNYRLLPHAIMTIARSVHQLYTTDKSARVWHHVSPPTDPLGFPWFITLANPLYRETTCATTACTGSWLQPAARYAIQAHNHIWTDMSLYAWDKNAHCMGDVGPYMIVCMYARQFRVIAM